MVKNYLKIAIRNLWKHKSFTIINVLGLAIAFGTTLLLSMTACQELSFDRFHEQKASLFQPYLEIHRATSVDKGTSVPIPFTPALKTTFPDLHISRWGYLGANILRYKDHEYNSNIKAVDPDFLTMFTFPLLTGDPQRALKDPADLVLTEKMAKAVFGKEEPVGKTVEIKRDTSWQSFVITAIAKDVPNNSSLEFSGLTRFENFPNYNSTKDDWDKSDHEVFVQLPSGTTQTAFEEKLKKFTHTYYKGDIEKLKTDGAQPDKEGEFFRVRLIPFVDLHFDPISNTATVNRFYPYLLLLISAFILFIASVNFVNLSLGRAFTRTREIGMRKVLGARRRQILLQFWGEALIISILALGLGILLSQLFLPGYKTLFQQSLSTTILRSPFFITAFLAGFLLVTGLAGGYPAWILSALNTSLSVKGKITATKNHRLRNGLMVIQFILSGLLIICTTIVWQQLNFMRTAPLGYNKEQVLSIPVGSHIDKHRALDLMRTRLAGLPNVLSVSGTDINLGRGRDGSTSTSIMGFDYKGKEIHTHWMQVDYDYVKTLGLRLLKGRDFSRAYGTDSGVVVINEKMAAAIGEKDPIGTVLPIGDAHLRVAGVVKDFHFKSLHQEIAPLTLYLIPRSAVNYILVKVTPTDLPGSLHAITAVWKNINPAAESGISFLDENTDKQYQKEARLSKIFVSGALIAILVSCMGLFAIVVLVMTQRTREIGIRKVLGASVTHILSLIARDFVALVLIAVMIASPIAWWLMHRWLQDFAYHIHIGPWVFLFSAATALLIALFTIGFQALKAAWASPVENLKSD
jgi:ABC-type antimicrobial peptide transport system permease subunit